MKTMPIDNHSLTQRRLQFIGIGVNKLTYITIVKQLQHSWQFYLLEQKRNSYENPGYLV